MYTFAQDTHKWVTSRRQQGARIVEVQCLGARHGLDNEIEPVGREMRGQLIEFTNLILEGKNPEAISEGSRCKIR